MLPFVFVLGHWTGITKYTATARATYCTYDLQCNFDRQGNGVLRGTSIMQTDCRSKKIGRKIGRSTAKVDQEHQHAEP